MRRLDLISIAAALAISVLMIAATPVVLGHGASQGLHVHASPEPVRPGGTLAITLEATESLSWFRYGIADQPSSRFDPDEPCNPCSAQLAVPKTIEAKTISLQVEAETVSGRTVVASAIVPIDTSKPVPDED